MLRTIAIFLVGVGVSLGLSMSGWTQRLPSLFGNVTHWFSGGTPDTSQPPDSGYPDSGIPVPGSEDADPGNSGPGDVDAGYGVIGHQGPGRLVIRVGRIMRDGQYAVGCVPVYRIDNVSSQTLLVDFGGGYGARPFEIFPGKKFVAPYMSDLDRFVVPVGPAGPYGAGNDFYGRQRELDHNRVAWRDEPGVIGGYGNGYGADGPRHHRDIDTIHCARAVSIEVRDPAHP